MKFGTDMYLNNLYKSIKLQGHGSKVKVTWVHVFVRFVSAWYPRAVLSLEREFYLLLLFFVQWLR